MSAVAVVPAATSVARDCTRSCCAGGVNVGSLLSPEAGHVGPCGGCTGLGVVERWLPRPPPSWPTMTIEVGILFDPVPTANCRLFFRLICRLVLGPAYGTEMMIGDHLLPAFVLSAAQLAGLASAL